MCEHGCDTPLLHREFRLPQTRIPLAIGTAASFLQAKAGSKPSEKLMAGLATALRWAGLRLSLSVSLAIDALLVASVLATTTALRNAVTCTVS